MTQRIGLVSLVVDDYDDALAFFVGKLGMARWLSSKILHGNLWDLLQPNDAGSRA